MRILSGVLATVMFLFTSLAGARSPVPQPYPPSILEWHKSVAQLHFTVDLEIFPGLEIPIEVMTATAWAVSPSTLVTAAHVCTTAQSISVETKSPDVFSLTYIEDDEHKEFKSARVWRIDPVNELCILYAPKHPLKPLEVEKNFKDNVHIFNHVSMVGAPMGVFPVVKDCVVVSKSGKELGDRYLADRLITSCEALPGFSGSPLISDTGKVVGVIAGGLLKSEWDPLSFATYGATAPQILGILKGIK